MVLRILRDAGPRSRAQLAGDTGLLTDIKTHLFGLLGQEDAFAGHFAKPTLAFPTPPDTIAVYRVTTKTNNTFSLPIVVRAP